MYIIDHGLLLKWSWTPVNWKWVGCMPIRHFTLNINFAVCPTPSAPWKVWSYKLSYIQSTPLNRNLVNREFRK